MFGKKAVVDGDWDDSRSASRNLHFADLALVTSLAWFVKVAEQHYSRRSVRDRV